MLHYTLNRNDDLVDLSKSYKLLSYSYVRNIFGLQTDSRPYQFLPSREGYVPVYIRMGDTPLDEINPELAVAFHEMVAVNGRQLKSNDEVRI